MKTSIKRVLAFLLAFAFVFGEMPLSTLAATPKKVRLTIVYEMPDGCETPAPASKKLEGAPGEAYVASSPKVEGFVADQEAVYGHFGITNETITVKYSPIYYVARVKYEVPKGYESKKPKNKHKTGSPGTEYSFKTPDIEGLIPDKDYVSGKIGNKDETFIVTYYADQYTVTVDYKVPTGFEAPASGSAVGVPGKEYTVKSPELKGLTPDKDEIKGNIGKADETKTVTYTLDKHTLTVNFEVPAEYESQKPESVEKTDFIGKEVTVPIPGIEGLYTAGTEVVKNIGYEDETVTVRYTDKLYTVIVQYEVPMGYEDKLPKQQTKTGAADEEFEIKSPDIQGLTPDRSKVSGKIGDYPMLDGYAIVPVTYSETTYTVTVNYMVPEGFTAVPEYKKEPGKHAGDSYSIPSPEVKGCYVKDENKEVVKGKITDSDVEVTVEYVESQKCAFVRYVVPEGYTAPKAKLEWGYQNDTFSIPSPTIKGLKLKDPDQAVITGTYGKEGKEFTVEYVVDTESKCPNSTDGLHRWGEIEECEDGWNGTSSLKFYPQTIDDYEYLFAKARTVCIDCGMVLAEYYKSGYDYQAYHSHPCNSDPNAEFYLPTKDFIDRGMYCETEACPHGMKNVIGHRAGVGQRVTAGEQYTATNMMETCGRTFTAPSSGTADDGKEFAAGDIINVCTGCNHVTGVVSRDPHNVTNHTVTVNYVVPEGNYDRKSWSIEETQAAGTTCEFRSPHIYRLLPDQEVINYTFKDTDEILTVKYYPADGYTVTINYEVPEGYTAPEPKVLPWLMGGEEYSVKSPLLNGLKPDRETVAAKVKDKITEGLNITETVNYTPSRRVTVYYKFPEGFTGAKDQTVIYYYNTGETYNITPPSYNDVAPWPEKVTGTMGDKDVEVDVVYDYNTAVLVEHKVTVNYLVPEGFTAPASVTKYYGEGRSYEIPSPELEGLAPDIKTVTGDMGKADVTVNVSYTKTYHTLTINYNVPAGYEKPESYTKPVRVGDEYVRRSPKIEGLQANPFTVYGNMGKEDITVEVNYTNAPVMLKPYTLTVNYTVPNEYAAYKPKTYTGKYSEGMWYSIPSPTIEGLVPAMDKVEGNMPGEDTTFEVTYKPKDGNYYYVTVHFETPEGYDKIPDFQTTGLPGTPYYIVAPHIRGLMLTEKSDVLSGKFKEEDQEFTFHYEKACTVYIRYYTEWGTHYWPYPESYYKVVPYGTHINVPSPKILVDTPKGVVGWLPVLPVDDVHDYTIYEDLELDVEYDLAPIVTVNYVYAGPDEYAYLFKQPKTHIEAVRKGGSYHVDSPTVENMKPKQAYVERNNVQENVVETVGYEPAGKTHEIYVYVEDTHSRRHRMSSKSCLEGYDYHIPAPKYTDPILGDVYTVTPSEINGTMGTEDVVVTFKLVFTGDKKQYEVTEGDDQTVTETEREDGAPEVDKSAQFKINADPDKVSTVMDENGNALREGKDYTVKNGGGSAAQKQNALLAAGSGESLSLMLPQDSDVAVDSALATAGEQVERLAADDAGNTTIIELTASYLDSLGPGEHMLLVNFTDGGAVMSFTIEGAQKWNLFEDDKAHDFMVKGIRAFKEAVNTNKTSAKFFDATLSENIISVSLKEGADRKKAANANTFDFDLGEEGTVSYVLPFTYNKPVLKLTSTKGTVKKGTETTLTTTVLYQTQNGNYVPFDLTGATVTYAGQPVTTGDDGLVSLKADGKRSGKIAITKDKWNTKDPVTLNYSIAEVKADKDVLMIDMGGLKQVTLNTNAPEQTFSFPLTLNGVPATADTVSIEKGKKGEEALGSISDGMLTVSLGRSGIKKGSYTLKLKAGKATLSVKVKVTDKALDNAASGKITQKYDVVTGKPMVIAPTLKEVQGSISAVKVSAVTLKKGTAPSASDFTAKVNNGNIEVSYSGSLLSAKNLKVGDMTFILTVTDNDGNKISVPLTVKNVSAKKTKPTVKAVKVTIPKASAEKADGKSVIGSANIISTYKDSAKHVQTIVPTKVTLECKSVEARADGNNGKILITKLDGNSGSVKATLIYPGGVTKTVTIKVSKGK
ncbi:MAG: hypothetical protein IJ058_06245 [Lachnospiraceae bacterium]|nr:hypothetical protein [Lachnospiraceae bacterium]